MLSLAVLAPVTAIFIVADLFYFLLTGRREKTLSQPVWALFALAISVGMLAIQMQPAAAYRQCL